MKNKYITPELKERLYGNLGLSYVITLDEGHNVTKKEDGTFEKHNAKLITADVVPQNDSISIRFDSAIGEPSEIQITSDELRAFAEELLAWADIVEETI